MAFDTGKAVGAAGDLFGGIGDIVGGLGALSAGNSSASALGKEATGYRYAADLEGENAMWAEASGNIQMAQQDRKNYEVLSGTREAAAAAGLNGGGSAGDILRENASQGALSTALLGVQKNINVNAYKVQQESYTQQADAADAAAAAAASGGMGGFLGGAMKGIGSIASMAATIIPML